MSEEMTEPRKELCRTCGVTIPATIERSMGPLTFTTVRDQCDRCGFVDWFSRACCVSRPFRRPIPRPLLSGELPARVAADLAADADD